MGCIELYSSIDQKITNNNSMQESYLVVRISRNTMADQRGSIEHKAFTHTHIHIVDIIVYRFDEMHEEREDVPTCNNSGKIPHIYSGVGPFTFFTHHLVIIV